EVPDVIAPRVARGAHGRTRGAVGTDPGDAAPATSRRGVRRWRDAPTRPVGDAAWRDASA
ncbi:hypothetical protein MHY85_00005, partial [Cellulomonas sp. ACRRI]|uniref:hypothetical protein n=1 Tax=Cellulomonas sp. ACRRI TaxID=2918188 RepID=UPI001EF238B9